MTLYNSEGGAVNVSADLVDSYILAGFKPAGVKKTSTDIKTEEPEKVETKKTTTKKR